MRITLLFFILLFSTSLAAQLRLDNNNHLFLNHSGGTIGASDFIISSEGGDFMGMYLNSNNSVNSRPFYGYSVDTDIKSFHHYEELSNSWKLWLDGNYRFEIQSDTTYLNTQLSLAGGLNVSNNIFVVDQLSNRLLYNYDPSRLNIGSANFVLNDDSFFGGMYINSDDVLEGRPFYGYAINGSPLAYEYLNAIDTSWHFVHYDGQEVFNVFKDRLSVNSRNFHSGQNSLGVPLLNIDDNNDKVYVNYEHNTGHNIGVAELVIRGNDKIYAGMYIDNTRTFNGNVFYGYSINGIAKMYSNYNDFSESWSIIYDNNGDVGISVRRKHTDFGGGINVKNVSPNGSFAGTIYYNNGHFWGITDSGVKQLDNTTNFNKPSSEKANSTFDLQKEIVLLQNENQLLKQKLSDLEEKVNKLMEE